MDPPLLAASRFGPPLFARRPRVIGRRRARARGSTRLERYLGYLSCARVTSMTSPPERRAAQSCRGSGGFSLFFVLASAEHRVRFFSINICSRSSFNRATLPFNMNPLETVKRHEQKSEVRPKLFERRTCTCFSLVHGSRRRMKRHRCDMQNDGAVDSPTLTLRWGEFESQVQLLYGQTDPNARGLSLLLSNMTANSRIDREVTHSSLQIF